MQYKIKQATLKAYRTPDVIACNPKWSRSTPSVCNVNNPVPPWLALYWRFCSPCPFLAHHTRLTHFSTSRPLRWSSLGRGHVWSSLSPSSVSSPPPPESQCQRDRSPGSTAWSRLSSCACIVRRRRADTSQIGFGLLIQNTVLRTTYHSVVHQTRAIVSHCIDKPHRAWWG